VFNGIEAVFVQFSHPSKNAKLIEVQENLKIKKSTLMPVCGTRWICRFKNWGSIMNTFECIIQILQEEIVSESDKNVAQAIG